MEVIVFHRVGKQSTQKDNRHLQQPSVPKDVPSDILIMSMPKEHKVPNARHEGLGQLSFELQRSAKGLILSVKAMLNETIPVRERVSLPLIPWTHVNVYYRPSIGKIQLVDATSVNANRSHVENSPENYLGRLIVTDTEALIYLRGRMPNIPGFKNILLSDTESSASAFARYSSKVKHFVEEASRRQSLLGKIDVYKQLACLEAQVDVLTKVILASGLVADEKLKAVLEEAQRFSMCENSNVAILKQKIQYKKVVRGTDGVC